jgi:DNA mismatch repair protein MSH2
VYAQRNGQWECVRRASPGNTTEVDELLEGAGEGDGLSSHMGAGTLAVWVAQQSGQRVIGVACADPERRTLCVSQFAENDHFANLESVVVQAAGARECCLLESAMESADMQRVRQILECCSVAVAPRKRADFKTDDVEQVCVYAV